MKRKVGSVAGPCGLVIFVLLACGTTAVGQQALTAPLPSYQAPLFVDSGLVENTGDEPAVVFSTPVRAPDATWLRLQFDVVELSGVAGPPNGSESYLRITSLLDGEVQYLDAVSVGHYYNTSAYFNGDELVLELVAYPNTGPSRIVMTEVTAGLPGNPGDSICGAVDDRMLSEDPRAGRLVPIGCTGWIISDCNHCFITAGHCIQNGTTNAMMEFNVPLSNGEGGITHPGVEDQYAVQSISIQSTGSGGIGNDAAYFGCNPNSNTGLTPFEAQGEAYTLAETPLPVQGQDIRITGYGSTRGTGAPLEWSQVQKTHTGPYVEFVGTTLRYAVDTSGGNSGSPVVDESSGLAIGVHTHAGCNSSGGNHGTGINHATWQSFLANPRGICGENLPCPACPGDLDGDGDTDLADLGILLADFGCPQPGPCVGDLDGDGDTDLADLGILLADFGCAP